jgi:flagellar biosynthesis protein FliP
MGRLLRIAAISAPMAIAQSGPGVLGVTLNSKNGSMSVPLQIVLLMTALTLLPAIIMSVTPFLRIVVVLHFLRQALGTQTSPSNQVLIGLSLFLTVLIMQPVLNEAYAKGWEPLEKGEKTPSQAWEAASPPIKAFLLKYAREKDIRLFLDISHAPQPGKPDDVGMAVLVPSYVLSELKTAFQIGAVLFLPFLMIDLIVASVTLSVGMVQLPPVMISAPFKILLFVLVDGWNLVVGSLVKTFY